MSYIKIYRDFFTLFLNKKASKKNYFLIFINTEINFTFISMEISLSLSLSDLEHKFIIFKFRCI